MIAIVGTIGFSVVAFVIYKSPFAQHTYFDGVLRFNMVNDTKAKRELENILQTNCKNFALITLRDMAQGERLDYAYQIKMKKNRNSIDLIEEIKNIGSVKGANLLMQEATVEV